ncbi:MAG: hypothetical protein U0169_15135 [Polyangiaceae bacterium]
MVPRTPRNATFSALAAWGAVILAPSVVLAADPPAADPSHEKMAERLFDEARALLDADHVSEACAKFAESQRLDPGGGTLLNLASCHERMGAVATAQAEFDAALSLALRDKRQDRETFARERLAALGPTVPRVTLSVGPEAARPDLVVTVDGREIPTERWGPPIALDPGRHTIAAKAPGHRPFSLTVLLRNDGATLGVEIPALAADAVSPTSPATRGPSPWFYAGAGALAAGLVTSAVTGGLALSAHGAVGEKCDRATGVCADPTGIDDASRARTLAWVSTVSLGVGVAGAVVMALAWPKSSAPATRTASLEVAPTTGGGVLTFRGSF